MSEYAMHHLSIYHPTRMLAALAVGLCLGALPPATAQGTREEFLAEGDRAFESGDFREALAAYSRISPVQIPVAAQNRLGMAYHRLGMVSEAAAIYRVARLRDREYGPVLSNIGALQYGLGEYGEAVSLFREALERVPGNPVVEGNLRAARYARANRASLRSRIAERTPEDPLLLDRIEGQLFGVTLLIEPAVQEELESLALRGSVFAARKLFEDAILEFEDYLAIDPNDVDVRNRLGITFQQAQRIPEAEAAYRQALDLNPWFVPALNNLGSIAQSRGDLYGALRYYQRALEVDQNSATVFQNLGACLFAMEQYEQGLLAYLRAFELDPDLFDRIASGGGALVQTTPGSGSMASFWLAKLFAQAGDPDRTMSLLYRAVEEGFDRPDLLEDPVFGVLRSDERFLRLRASFGEAS